MLSTGTKAKRGTKAAKGLVKNPGVLQLASPAAKGRLKLAKPLAKRRTRKRVERIGETAREIAMTLATYAPDAARALGILPPKKEKQKLVIPLAAAGAALGAGAVYFLEPKRGRAHRAQVARLVS
jgi:hypothetical protein